MKPMSIATSLAASALLGSTLLASQATATTLEISITNNQSEDGLYLTPLFLALHDGGFDAFDAGSAASAGVEALAEGGDASGVIATAQGAGAQTGVITSPGGFGPLPIIDPGETASIRINVDPSTGRYLSFLSMIIPSNDGFIGNDNPEAYAIFDDTGTWAGLGPIEVTLADIWDAGTEVNDNLGAAFNTAGGTSTDEDGTIGLFGDLSVLFGQNTADGTTIGSTLGSSLATITVASVPLPAGLPLLGSALLLAGLAGRRRTTNKA
jgi:hypothetical protein